MRSFLFVGGATWILVDPEEVAVVRVDDGSTALLLFSDQPLADAYIAENGLAGKVATCVKGPELLGWLKKARGLGVRHVAIDHTPGRHPQAQSRTRYAMSNVKFEPNIVLNTSEERSVVEVLSLPYRHLDCRQAAELALPRSPDGLTALRQTPGHLRDDRPPAGP
jgi:hypothetical protein